MPLPSQHKGETHDEFMERCMDDDALDDSMATTKRSLSARANGIRDHRKEQRL